MKEKAQLRARDARRMTRGLRRFVPPAAALAVALAAPVAIVCAAGLSIFGVDLLFGDVLVVLLSGVASLATIIFAAVMAARRRWRPAIGLAVLPASLALTLLYASELETGGTTLGEYLRFRHDRAAYLAEITRLPAATEPRLAVFQMSRDGFVTHTNYHLVVYDESDEIALPDARRSPAWRTRIRDTVLESGAYYVAAQGAHFYIVRVFE